MGFIKVAYSSVNEGLFTGNPSDIAVTTSLRQGLPTLVKALRKGRGLMSPSLLHDTMVNGSILHRSCIILHINL